MSIAFKPTLTALVLTTLLTPTLTYAQQAMPAPDTSMPAPASPSAPAVPDTATPAAPVAPALPDTIAPAAPQPTMQPQASAPPEEPRRSNRFRFGPEIGLYFPTNSKTRDRFGKSWFSIGFGLNTIAPPSQKGALTLDFNSFFQNYHGNNLFLAPVGVRYTHALTQGDQSSIIPYAGAAVDVAIAGLKIPQDNIKYSVRTGFAGSVFTGVNIAGSGYLEVNYQAVSRIKSLDLSGLSLKAGIRF